MTPATFKTDLGERKKIILLFKMLPAPPMLAAVDLWPTGLPWQDFPFPAASPPAAAHFGASMAVLVVKKHSCSASIVSSSYWFRSSIFYVLRDKMVV